MGVALPAPAAEGLYLSWDDCRMGAWLADKDYLCNDVLGSQSLVCAFQLGAPLDGVISAEFVVDVQQATDPLPPWWRWDAAGCAANMLSASADFTTAAGCGDAWNGVGSALVQQILPGEPRGAASQMRIVAVASVPSIQAVALDAAGMYNGVRLVVSDMRLAACTGCSSPACLVLNGIRLLRLPPAESVLIETPGPSGANLATWRGGTGAPCAAVPVRTPTWGGIKSLYR